MHYDDTNSRHDVWKSKEDAREWHLARAAWKKWDSRVLNIFIDGGGLRALPTAMYPDKREGVTLSCYRTHEAFNYANFSELESVIRALETLLGRVLFHIVYGKSFFRPTEQATRILKEKYGATLNIHEMKDVGHSIVQEAPSQLALLVQRLICGPRPSESLRSRL